jgi:hypothetical protein
LDYLHKIFNNQTHLIRISGFNTYSRTASYLDKVTALTANTDGWGNKLVTIFARYPDSFIVTIKFTIIYQTRDFGSGQIQPLDKFLVRRDLQKLRHTLLAP